MLVTLNEGRHAFIAARDGAVQVSKPIPFTQLFSASAAPSWDAPSRGVLDTDGVGPGVLAMEGDGGEGDSGNGDGTGEPGSGGLVPGVREAPGRSPVSRAPRSIRSSAPGSVPET